MSLTYEQMKGILHQMKPFLEGAIFDHCITANERKLILHFKNQTSLLLCFQDPFLRFHMTKHHWKDHPLPFSKLLTQHLHLWHVVGCELFHEDRILLLTFRKGDETKKLICEFIPKKANCFLVDHKEDVLLSLLPTAMTSYQSPSTVIKQIFPVTEFFLSEDIESHYRSLEQQAEFQEKKHLNEAQLKSQLKQSLRAQSKFLQELEAALRWEEVQHEATLLQSNLFMIKKGMPKISVNDWLKDNVEVEIMLDTSLSPAEEVSKRFQKSKKLKRAIEPLKRQYEKTTQNVEKISSLLDLLKNIQSDKELDAFCRKNHLVQTKVPSNKFVKPTPALPYREFITENGLRIWVGKSAKDNDKLTFSCGHGSDYWLHARNVPGSHVVLHLGKHKEPDEESIKDAVQAALFYSKAKDSHEGEVSITQCKYVSRYGNQPGKVQISEQRVVYAKIDQARLKKLKDRKA